MTIEILSGSSPSSAQVPHLALPLILGADGSFATVQQDTEDEVAQSVEVILGSTPGVRTVEPAFGTNDPTFTTDESIAAAVQNQEPRAAVTITTLQNANGTETVNVNVKLNDNASTQ